MKTTALDADSIDDQMFADASGEKKMQIGKGSSATSKPEDAVDTPAAKPAATTGNATKAPATRLLQDAATTSAGNATKANSTDWKKLKKEEDYMRVVVNKKMFEKGGPLFGIKKPIIMFNKHSPDYVAEFPRARKGTFDKATGKKLNATAAAAAAAKVNLTDTTATVDENDAELNDTVAQ